MTIEEQLAYWQKELDDALAAEGCGKEDPEGEVAEGGAPVVEGGE